MSTRPEWEAWVGVGVAVHLRSGVELASTVYAEDARVVVHVRGANFTDVHLYADRADLDRLHETVTAARDQLAPATATATTDDPSTAADAA